MSIIPKHATTPVMINIKSILSEIYFNGFTVSEANTAFHKPENFDSYASGKGWTAWRGENDWETGITACSVVFEGPDRNRIWFTVKYPDDIREFVGEGLSKDHPQYDRINKFGKRISTRWIREAQRLHRIPKDYNNEGKPIRREWNECFMLALGSERMRPYVKESGVDYTKWHAMRRTK